MGEVIRFVPRSERDRARLIQEARAIYDGIFPSAGPVGEQQEQAPPGHTVSRAGAHSRAGALVS